jgi:hypothetical protein
MDLYHLVYTSSPAKVFDDSALEELLTMSREANSRFDVTGVLMYLPDSFIQLIEGPKQHITRLYANIKRDKRHLRVTTLREGPITDRFFSDWAMAFQRTATFKSPIDPLTLQDEKVLRLFGILEN